MKKIISIILGIMLMFAMSVTSFAANINDEITPNPETIVFEIGCVKAVPAKDADGKDIVDDMIYTFETKVSNKTKSNINISNYPVALIFINDKTYETIDVANFDLADKWINANYHKTWADLNDDNDAAAPNDTVKNTVRMDYDEATTVDIKVMIAGKTADDETAMIKTLNDKVVITLDVTPKAATPDAPATETTTDAPTTEAPTTSKPADTTTEAPTTEAPVDTTVPTVRPSVPTTNASADVDPEIPDTGATVPFAAIGTLVTSAITALVAKKKKEN